MIQARRTVLVTHPDNFPVLREADAMRGGSAGLLAAGIPVHGDFNVPRFAMRWKPPADRFVEWEASDLVWLKYFGMGTTVQTNEPAFYLLDFGAFIPPLVMPAPAMPALRPLAIHSLS